MAIGSERKNRRVPYESKGRSPVASAAKTGGRNVSRKAHSDSCCKYQNFRIFCNVSCTKNHSYSVCNNGSFVGVNNSVHSVL